MYQTKDVVERFGISPQTVRTYSDEFGQYLSATANPPPGQQRNFNDDDLEVFALVVELKRQGSTYEAIHAALAAGQRGSVPQNAPFLDGIAGSNREQSSIVSLRRELTVLKQFHEQELQALRTERDKAAGQAEAYKDQLQAKEQQIESLNEKIIELRVKLAKSDDTD